MPIIYKASLLVLRAQLISADITKNEPKTRHKYMEKNQGTTTIAAFRFTRLCSGDTGQLTQSNFFFR